MSPSVCADAGVVRGEKRCSAFSVRIHLFSVVGLWEFCSKEVMTGAGGGLGLCFALCGANVCGIASPPGHVKILNSAYIHINSLCTLIGKGLASVSDY